MTNEAGFGKFRSLVWPVHRHELIKFVPTFLLFFFVAFNYHLLKIIKDPLIITAPESGAQVIPFLKVWAILPSAIGMTFLFTSLSNRFNRENIFYVLSSVFLGFFVLFIFVIYPNKEHLSLDSFSNYLTLNLPSGFNGFISIIRYWYFSLFYVMAEAWSTIMLSVLLWGFVIDVIPVPEAKRFYSLFGIARNGAGIFAGKLGIYFSLQMEGASDVASFLGPKESWNHTLMMFVLTICLVGVIIMGIYRWLHKYIYPERKFLGLTPDRSRREKISLKESLLYVVKSKYVLYITILILSYNIVINLTEVLWKSQLKELYPGAADYTAYFSKVTYYIGVVATIFTFLFSGNIIRRLGWKFAALVTPISILITGVGFFYFLFVKQYHIGDMGIVLMGLTPLGLTVFFGSLQNCFSRAFKYTIFDDTKEMACIPLSPENKIKTKSALDGIGSRLGKSGSSLLLQFMLLISATPAACSPFIFVIILVLMPVWFLAINSLSKNFEKMSQPAASDKATEPVSN
ncbi:MAG: NTP/NDP exchange transporter [Chlamydiae bacterium]|nr:NTP/NDP exchange transporter [Chlamydiota bacterium]